MPTPNQTLGARMAARGRRRYGHLSAVDLQRVALELLYDYGTMPAGAFHVKHRDVPRGERAAHVYVYGLAAIAVRTPS